MDPREQRLWTACRILHKDVEAATAALCAEVEPGFAEAMLEKWCEDGFCRRTRDADDARGISAAYRIAKDVTRFPPGDDRAIAIAAARLVPKTPGRAPFRRDPLVPKTAGYRSSKPRQAVPVRQRIWNALREEGEAIAHNLAEVAIAGAATVTSFLRELERAGYVRLDGHRAELLRDTGPSAPVRWGHAFEDPNDGASYILGDVRRAPVWGAS